MTWEWVVLILGILAWIAVMTMMGISEGQHKRAYEEARTRRGS